MLGGLGEGGGGLLIPEHHLGKAVSKAHFQFTPESLVGAGERLQSKTQQGINSVFLKVQCVRFDLVHDFYIDKS